MTILATGNDTSFATEVKLVKPIGIISGLTTNRSLYSCWTCSWEVSNAITNFCCSLDANNKKASEGMERAERNADSLGAGDSYVGDSLDRSSEVWHKLIYKTGPSK